jgi:aminoglycoside phosphotransferase (APT) family kinase protein
MTKRYMTAWDRPGSAARHQHDDGMNPFHPRPALDRFAFTGEVQTWERYGNGHINDTLLVTCAGGSAYIAQRLNANVFPDGAAVMNNIARVLDHLARSEPDPTRRLSLIPTRDGARFLVDAEGRHWRAYPFIAGARTVECVSDPALAQAAAGAFARFLAVLADLPGAPLATVIAGFHDTPARLARLAAVAHADLCGRRSEAAEEVAWALGQTTLAGSLLSARDRGGLFEIPTHNDTKINNLLMEPAGHAAQCVIDLDTLMPGLPLYDFGDLVRTASCRAVEDADPGEMVPDMELIAGLVDGWLHGRGGALQPAERDLMAVAGAVITFETGTRFLTYHLDGDRYFRIKRPGHNLRRARAQFALARGLLARRYDISALVAGRIQACVAAAG